MAEHALRNAFGRMFRSAIDTLNRSGLRYYVLGGVAANALARPRTTEDLDVATFASAAQVESLLEALRGAGFRFDDEEVRTQLEIRGFLRVYYPVSTGKKLWTDIVVAATRFEERVWTRRWLGQAEGLPVSVVSPEDFLLLKVLARRPKDLEDIRSLIARRGPHLDREYLREAVEELAALAHCPDLPAHLEMALRGEMPPPTPE